MPIVRVADDVIEVVNPAFVAWFPEVATGGRWSELFTPASADELTRLAEQGWLGLAERRFSLKDGRWVQLVVSLSEPAAELWFALYDVSARHALDAAAEQQRRMEAIASLASTIARELNDPMSIVQGRLELLAALGDTADRATVARHVQIALEHARRVGATLRNLRMVGREVPANLEGSDVEEAVREALELLGPSARLVELRLAPGVQVGGDMSRIARVLGNVLRRALELSPRGVRLVSRRGREDVEIDVVAERSRPEEQRARPTTDVLEHTLLASVGARVEELVSRNGTTWAILLPTPHAQRARSRPIDGRIVVVGRPALHQAVHQLLSREGYEIATVGCADAALAAVALAPTDAVITELLLDGASGLVLAAELARRFPGLHGRIFVFTEVQRVAVPPEVRLLTPPLRRGAVLEALGRRVRRA